MEDWLLSNKATLIESSRPGTGAVDGPSITHLAWCSRFLNCLSLFLPVSLLLGRILGLEENPPVRCWQETNGVWASESVATWGLQSGCFWLLLAGFRSPVPRNRYKALGGGRSWYMHNWAFPLVLIVSNYIATKYSPISPRSCKIYHTIW